MNKVYLVQVEYEQTVCGVFSTEAKAEKFIQAYDKRDEMHIQEYTIDPWVGVQ